jgi:hypothetical protein
MKPTACAAIAALLAVARMASAQTTGSSDPAAADAAVRATTEARALVATMQHNARVAFEALEFARARKRRDEVRCADDALSRADVALRRSRDDAAVLDAALASRDAQTTLSALARIRMRAVQSHEAQVAAVLCSAPEIITPRDRTLVTVHVDPAVARFAP